MFAQIPHYDCIVAMIPTYTPTGDITTILTTNGQKQEVERPFRTVVNRLARSLSIDLVALKEKVALATGKAMFQPLPLAPGLVLCPFKVRQPYVPGDPTSGYINFHAVADVMKNYTNPYQSTIKLVNGIEIPLLWTVTTVKEHLQLARLAISYDSCHPQISPELSLHVYYLMKEFSLLISRYQTPNQNFMPIPK